MSLKKYPFLGMPKSLANVEIEKDETVMLPTGDVYKIEGKKHSQGGEHIFLPDGSKVFSQHLKLPSEIASKLTGRKEKSKSPAQLSKRFGTEKYKEMMENKTGKWDRLARETAEMMFNKNVAHQNSIFEAQEDFKEPNQSDIFKYGGKYQAGGPYPYSLNPGVLEEDDLVTFNFGDLNTGLQHSSASPDLFGKQKTYNPAHQTWYKYYYGDDFNASNFQQRHNEFYRNFTGQEYQYDNKTQFDGKYGNVTAHAPLPSVNVIGGKAGTITLEDYLNNPDIGSDFGLDKSSMEAIFKKDNPNPYYQVNIEAPYSAMSVETGRPEDRFTGGAPLQTLNPPMNTQPNLPKLNPQVPQPIQPVQPGTQQPGMTPEDMLYGVQQGLLLTQMASLGKENPYYSRTELTPIYKRFDPINNLAQERAFNLVRENIENSNLPEQVKQSQMQSMYSQMLDATGQVDLQNYQGKLQTDNENRQILQSTLNQNVQNREIANRQYAMDKARVDELYNRQKMMYANNMLDLWRDRIEEKRNIGLLNQMSRNYSIVNGQIVFNPGQGTNIDPNIIRNSYR